ncbi:MAG TPA: Glu/Leu/Phe/Val dehydrogenase dimerization domain-containing protein, partial [Candidatus Ozemobacteraceae bacterium]|nr:Glu/Leu/Phe/Val dehydrogenase dimerization domain-containing protein [Candidatus Ozemobacteraceae bacterium]
MAIFEELRRNRHENLFFLQHRESGLRGVLAIHDSSLGPAIGGVCCREVESEDRLAAEALLLAEQASLAAATFGTDCGGGKAILWCRPEQKNEWMFRAFGAYLEGLGGRFIASPDLGTTAADMSHIARETRFVAGVPKPDANEPSDPYTALTARGVFLGIKAAVKAALGASNLSGLKIGVQGLGKVGLALVSLIVAEHGIPYITDRLFEQVKTARDRFHSAVMVRPNDLWETELDVLAPCACSAVLSDSTVERLNCRIVAGAASRQHTDERVIERLHERGILYIPEFVINGGDMLLIDAELRGQPAAAAVRDVELVYARVEALL